MRRFSDFQHELSFFNIQENFNIYYQRFLSSDLGKTHTVIPFDDLIKHFKLKENHKSTKNLFSPKGKIALMFLKHYSVCSDKKLIELLNGNTLLLVPNLTLDKKTTNTILYLWLFNMDKKIT